MIILLNLFFLNHYGGINNEKNNNITIECFVNICCVLVIIKCSKISRVFHDRNRRSNWSLFPNWKCNLL